VKRVIIIGGGITGAAIARTLSCYEDIQIHLIEQAPDVGWGVTKANTGIIHPGHEEDPDLHPLRARLCVAGNRLWHEWVSQLDIPVCWPGELMLAHDEQECAVLQHYQHLGERNGVREMHVIEAESLPAIEHCTPAGAVAGLVVPSAGLVAPWEAVIALVENAVANGVRVHLNTQVTGIQVRHGAIQGVQTTQNEILADVVINAAGLHADTVSAMAGIDSVTITPRRGQYILFDAAVEPHPQKIMHFTPTVDSKGIYAVTTVEGNLMLGPTSETLSPDEKATRATTAAGIEYIWQHAATLLSFLPPRSASIKLFSGLRPEPQGGRYIVCGYDIPDGFINVAGIRSPGLTAAPAIAQHVTNELVGSLFELTMKPPGAWQPIRHRRPLLTSMIPAQQLHHIAGNPASGRVICRCKGVTEMDIVDAIGRIKQLGTDTVTLDSIKFWTLAMFGHCQGTFCRVGIARVIARELGLPLWEVTLSGRGTPYAIGDIKTLQTGSGDIT